MCIASLLLRRLQNMLLLSNDLARDMLVFFVFKISILEKIYAVTDENLVFEAFNYKYNIHSP